MPSLESNDIDNTPRSSKPTKQSNKTPQGNKLRRSERFTAKKPQEGTHQEDKKTMTPPSKKKKKKQKRKKSTSKRSSPLSNELASDIRSFWKDKKLTTTTKSPDRIVNDVQPQDSIKDTKTAEKKKSINPILIPSGKTIIIKQEWNGNIPDRVFPEFPEKSVDSGKVADGIDNVQQVLFPATEDDENEKEDGQLDSKLDNLYSVNKEIIDQITPPLDNKQPVNEMQQQENLENDEIKKSPEDNGDMQDSEFPVSEYDEDYNEEEILDKDERNMDSSDDENTISSGNTTIWGTKEELDEIRELPSVRYQFSFLLEDVSLEQLKKEHDSKDKKQQELEPADLIKKMLNEFYKKLMEYDKQAKLLSWSSKGKKGASYLSLKKNAKLSDDPIVLVKYFKGLNMKQKSGRVYL